MFNSLRKRSATRRCASIVISFLFLIFLVGTQPHRVHHLFETLSYVYPPIVFAADDLDHDHTPYVPAQSGCVIQTTAQNSHMGQPELSQIPFIESAFGPITPALTQPIHYFSFAPFLRRAPPGDALFS
jgi:hypothetical protein